MLTYFIGLLLELVLESLLDDVDASLGLRLGVLVLGLALRLRSLDNFLGLSLGLKQILYATVHLRCLLGA